MSTSMLVVRQVVILLLALGAECVFKTKREIDVEMKLKQLNKPAVKSIQSEDGDVIDCVDIYKQPAFDHPLLKQHTIKIRPSRAMDPKQQRLSPIVQLWQKSGSCPEGSVPIRRTKKGELMNAISLEYYGKKPQSSFETRKIKLNNFTEIELSYPLDHSLAMVVTGGSFTGAKGVINIWNPRVEMDDEYSSGQIWLTTADAGNYSSIEVGWMVNPSLYADRRTRIFIYWTRDGGRKTGCFNLLCSGFVQTSKNIAMGSTIWPLSVYNGTQHIFEYYVFQDKQVDVWWLQIQGENLGYWPNSLFMNTELGQTTPIVQFGGDVYSKRRSPHTSTEMGSGHFSGEHYGHTGWFQIAEVERAGVLRYPPNPQAFSLEPECYGADIYPNVFNVLPHFYFGGPGRSQSCP